MIYSWKIPHRPDPDEISTAARTNAQPSTLDRIDFHRLDLNAVGLKPRHGFFDFLAIAFELQRDDADGRRDRGVADIEYHAELAAHLTNKRTAAALPIKG